MMTVKDVFKMYQGQYADKEVYAYSDKVHRLNAEFLESIDTVYGDEFYLDKKVEDYSLMNEEEYNSTIWSSMPFRADFADLYGDKTARILVVVLNENWNREEQIEDEPVTEDKIEMAKTLISLPGWDGESNEIELCKRMTGNELQDILQAYEMEFSDTNYDGTYLELKSSQIDKIDSAQERYDKKNTQRISLKLNKTTDSDILVWLNDQASKQGAIKDAIRYYIKNIKL